MPTLWPPTTAAATAQIMLYPAVALGQGGPRFAITAKMSTADIDQLVGAVCVTLRALPLVQQAYHRDMRMGAVPGACIEEKLARLAGRGSLPRMLLCCLPFRR